MKKKIIGLLIMSSICFNMVGCSIKVDAQKQKVDVPKQKVDAQKQKVDVPKQFETISQERVGSYSDNVIIIKHIETGKRFIIYKGDSKGGIVPLD